MLASRTFENNLATVIPGGPAVVSSTIPVSGLKGHIVDVEVWLLLSHARPEDLDVTLTTPTRDGGRTVTLTTDNGGATANAFMGTVFRDRANPGGPAPYLFNAGLVSDHPYGSAGTTVLAPEEPLAMLQDEPLGQGDWRLTISDDTAGVGGTLFAWTLVLWTSPRPLHGELPDQIFNFSPVTIPAGAPGVVTSTISVPPSGRPSPFLHSLDVTTEIDHTASGDLDITLTSPAGTSVTLTSDNGGSLDDVFASVLWRDNVNIRGQVPYETNPGLATDHPYADGVSAGALAPEEPLAAFRGEDPAGVWTLTISDDTAGDGGTLNRWSLRPVYQEGCSSKSDANGDLDDDLVLRNLATNQHALWLMDGVTRVSEVPLLMALAPSERVVGTDDFIAGVTHSELVVRDMSSGAVRFVGFDPLTGATSPLNVPLVCAPPLPILCSPPPEWTLAATGDFNHDGYADLLWRNVSTQKLEVWTLGLGGNATRRLGTIVPVPSQAVDANWEVAAALDFDHDNNRDLLWYNNSSGRIVIWFMNASLQRISGAFTEPPSAADANWRVVAGGDYGPGPDGDSVPDIVWRNGTSGRLVVWFMDGGTSPPTRLAGTFTNPASPADPLAWTVVGPK